MSSYETWGGAGDGPEPLEPEAVVPEASPTEGEGVALTNEVAERSVVGAVLVSADVIWEVLELVRPGDFNDPALAAVMEGVLELAREGKPVDAITVDDHLRRTGRLKGNVTTVLLHELAGEVPTAANAGYYARIVSDLAKRRRLAGTALQMSDLAVAAGDVESVIESARALLDEVAVRTAPALEPIATGAKIEQLVDELADDAGKRTLATPWPALDRIIGGLRPGTLVVVAARPGVGKTVVGLQIARELAQAGPVGFVSLEMRERELLKRLVASTGSVSLTALENQQLTETDWRSFALAAPALQQLELFVRDDLHTLAGVLAFARTLHRQGRMQALVIDYLQLIRADERAESREAELSSMTRAFKLLSLALDVPIVLLSQLNRQSTQRKGKGADRPQLSDLRGSGAIEQDADVVLLLHREKPKDAVLGMAVAKNRQGPEGLIELEWQGAHARAVPKVWSPTALYDEGVDDAE